MLITCLLALPSSSQPIPPLVRTSSREPSSMGDIGTGPTVQDVEKEVVMPAPTLGVPGDQSGSFAGLSGSTANEKAESIGRSSKRSITGRRKRDASATSKRSGQGQ